MAWLGTDGLEYDVAALNAMKKSVDDTCTEVKESKKNLIQNLDSLKTAWNTPAGKKFFQDIDTDWGPKVDKYAAALDTLSQMLESASKSYKTLDDEISQWKKP